MEVVQKVGPLTFDTLLRSYREAAGLTQAELAERARLSDKGIAALETGTHVRPRRKTVELLAQALGLSDERLALFEAAARGRPVPDPYLPASPNSDKPFPVAS